MTLPKLKLNKFKSYSIKLFESNQSEHYPHQHFVPPWQKFRNRIQSKWIRAILSHSEIFFWIIVFMESIRWSRGHPLLLNSQNFLSFCACLQPLSKHFKLMNKILIFRNLFDKIVRNSRGSLPSVSLKNFQLWVSFTVFRTFFEKLRFLEIFLTLSVEGSSGSSSLENCQNFISFYIFFTIFKKFWIFKVHWEKWIVNGNEKHVTGYNLGLLTMGQRSKLLKP